MRRQAAIAIIAGVIAGIGCYICQEHGRNQGRAEQKKIDEAECAKQRVDDYQRRLESSSAPASVKLQFWKDEDGRICREDSHGKEGITCLNLEKPRDGICQGWGDIWWTNLPCPVRAKPAKGSKRDCQYPEGCVTISQKTYFDVVDQLKRDAITMEKGAKEIKRLTAQPIPEKEPPTVRFICENAAWKEIPCTVPAVKP